MTYPRTISLILVALLMIAVGVQCAPATTPPGSATAAPAAKAEPTKAPAATAAPAATKAPAATTAPAAKGTTPPAATATPIKVAILVIDDFSFATPLPSTPEARKVLATKNCLITPEGQICFAEGAAGGKDHGQKVYGEVAAGVTRAIAKEPTRQSLPTPSGAWQAKADVWGFDKGQLFLVGVNTDGFTTDLITPNIKTVMDELTKLGISKFVLNMSFAIVPCSPGSALGYTNPQKQIEAYKKQLGNETWAVELNTYLDQLSKSPNISVAEVDFALYKKADALKLLVPLIYGGESPWYSARLSDNDPDPLYQFLKGRRQDVISIAAAGNYGFKFPFAPGLWPFVVSVSASGTEGTCNGSGQVAPWSNWGEVSMDGNPANKQNPGTSFAAPKLSALTGLYLLNGGSQVCQGSTTPTSPPLKSYPVSKKYECLPLGDALKYCKNFLTPTP